MAVPDNVKTVLAALLSMLLLWKPAIVSFFPGFIYTSDLTTVTLVDACIGASTQTVFVFCLIEVLVSCVLLTSYVLPSVFGEVRWTSYDNLKQQKMVGFFVKIGVRVAVAVQVLCLVMPWVSIQNGLFGDYNMKQAYINLVSNGKVDTCAQAGMTLRDAVALRAWTFARDDMMAVMVWELAFIPSLPLDAWLHHLFVIFGVTIGSDPRLLGARAGIQPYVDAISFFLVLGAAFAALVEGAVLMYHFRAPAAAIQARWMMTSMAIQATIVVVFFGVLPTAFVVRKWDSFGSLAFGFLAVLAFLVLVEIKMLVVKWAIVKSAWRKALRQSESDRSVTVGANVDQEAGRAAGSFHHDISQEAKAMDQENLLGEENMQITEMSRDHTR